MGTTDLISDTLVIIKNGCSARKESVRIKYSKINNSISTILKTEGFIRNFNIVEDGNNKKSIFIELKYDNSGKSIIHNIQRISKSSRRYYVKNDKIPRIANGYGIAILTTHKGVITDKDARKMRVGGEVICSVI